jgi:hypothetical protein
VDLGGQGGRIHGAGRALLAVRAVPNILSLGGGDETMR